MRAVVLVVAALCGMFVGCESDSSPDSDNLAFTGTVKWQPLESGFYAIDADDGQKYEPINLPSEYQVKGMRVRVTAKERNDMASINMYGTIIEITSISRL